MPDRTRRGLLALTAAGIAAAGCAPAARVAATSRRDGDGAGEVQVVDGVRIHLRSMGTGPAVTLVHGASGNLHDMTFRLAPALAPEFRVIVVDRPGHGLSGMPPGGAVPLSVQAALMRRALAQAGVGRTLLVGHSYGGSVALAWALDAPGSVDGLGLLAAPSQVWQGGLGLTTDLLASPVIGPVLAGGASKVITRGFAERTLETVFAPQPVPADYLDHLGLDRVLQPASLRENARQLDGLKAQIATMVPRYPGLAMPVEIMHGDADRTVGIDIHSVPLADQLPKAQFTRMPGLGHMLHQVATDEVVLLVRRLRSG
jgi:pimeloyl-ACP methyl ester carboxylesterase